MKLVMVIIMLNIAIFFVDDLIESGDTRHYSLTTGIGHAPIFANMTNRINYDENIGDILIDEHLCNIEYPNKCFKL